ncbi:hypothetical protein GQS78_10170 [Thermococcus bergensis]|uniref:hypothetical protein n=1 Tax=Thermococcus bergensis TaxID=2689387 RepID=UPI001CEDC14E|nr:hypothetical protein [Thermococcus bergensis]MCA6214600.1 hypothetical protein [Thermococcus bergensis]
MKKALAFGILMLLLGAYAQIIAAAPNEINPKARTYTGWEEGYLGFTPVPQSTWMVVKWSKDWNFPFGEGSPEGAWLTVHFTWYTNNINISAGFFGHGEGSLVYWGNPDTVPEAKYRVEEYSKVMILNNPEKYEEKGAVPANELGYPFPDNAYVVHWSVEIYNATTGELLFEVSLVPSLD